MTPQEFISAIAPAAVASARLTGLAPSFVIAQASLESGWDKSELALKAKNLFGVKSSLGWHGATIDIETEEFLSGHYVMVPAVWRVYETWQACFDDHVAFFTENERYKEAWKVRGDPMAFAAAIKAAGYCTDPLYVGKIKSVIDTHDLTQYDRAVENA
jgi:flagellum-specific peptidoglycan hydrolase FlgJ